MPSIIPEKSVLRRSKKNIAKCGKTHTIPPQKKSWYIFLKNIKKNITHYITRGYSAQTTKK